METKKKLKERKKQRKEEVKETLYRQAHTHLLSILKFHGMPPAHKECAKVACASECCLFVFIYFFVLDFSSYFAAQIIKQW